MAILASSVGFIGKNQFTDVLLVQTLLTVVPSVKGGAIPPLEPDGIAGPLTNTAIAAFQQKQTKQVTGRIEPGDATEDDLATEVKAVGFVALLPPGAQPNPPPTQPPDPGHAPTVPPAPPPAPLGGTGNLSPFRTQFRKIIEEDLKIPKQGTTNGHAPLGAKKRRFWLR